MGIPVKQLDDSHYEDWDGINVQIFAREPPKENMKTLALYIVDVATKASKRFKITEAIKGLANRKTWFIAYGTTHEQTKQQVKIVLQWEKEIRI